MYVGDMESQATLASDESSANDGDLSAADKVRWKRAKLDLLAKHVVSAPTRDIDIQQYRCLNMSPMPTHRIPTAIHVSQSQSAPATSDPSERIFSTAEMTDTSKRSQLSPSNINKIIFVYENEHFC